MLSSLFGRAALDINDRRDWVEAEEIVENGQEFVGSGEDFGGVGR